MNIREELKADRGLTVLLVCFFCVYLYFAAGYLSNVMLNSQTNLTVALVEDQSVRITPYAGNSNDVSKIGEDYYSGMPPGLSFAMVPYYLALKVLLLPVPNSFLQSMSDFVNRKVTARHSHFWPSEKRIEVLLLNLFALIFLQIPLVLLVTFFFAKFLQSQVGIGQRDSWFLSLFLLFATSFGRYAVSLYHTEVAACLLFLSFFLIQNYWRKEMPTKYLVLVGFMLGAIPSFDYPTVVYVGLTLLYGLWAQVKGEHLRAFTVVSAAFLVPFLGMLLYHYIAFGTPFTTSYNFRIISPSWVLIHREYAEIGIWTYLPTIPKLIRALVNLDFGILWYNPAWVLGVGGSAWMFFRSTDQKIRSMMTYFFLMQMAVYGYFASLPGSVGLSWGHYGSRYTLYANVFSLIVVGYLLKELWTTDRAKKILFFSALPFTFATFCFWFYGSPNRTFSQYIELFAKLGPTNYTLHKMAEGGVLQSPWIFSALGLCLLAMATWGVTRIVDRALR